jgi:pyruvate,orthophosphate dikinase
MTKDIPPRIVFFGPGNRTEIPPGDFGNKAAGLGTMSSLGIPIPPGFAINVSICEDYYKNGMKDPPYLPGLLHEGILHLEHATGLQYGSERKPLLVSVRSGAPASMPGIMDTILNVGLNHETIRGLIFLTGNPRFAWDSYRRLFENMAEIVFSQDPHQYRVLLSKIMEAEGISDVVEMDSTNLKKLADEYQRLFFTNETSVFPEDVHKQLLISSIAVLRSWTNPRAESFRRMHGLKNLRGTAITIQAMVFGNMGLNSGAGVAFTRNPWSGENEPLIDFKFGAQGEDVVSGNQSATTQSELKKSMPSVYEDLMQIGRSLESHFQDMQDMEFTVQEGKLYILQTRNGKRSPLSAIRIAVDLWREGIVTPEIALSQVEGIDLGSIKVQCVSTLDYPIAAGTSASGGVATGSMVFTPGRAIKEVLSGSVILVRETASPEDIEGIRVASGLLTAKGTRTSHAAVVARHMGKVCIVNCEGLEIDLANKKCNLGGQVLREGDIISLDGNSGSVYTGVVGTTYEKPGELLDIVYSWKTSMLEQEYEGNN